MAGLTVKLTGIPIHRWKTSSETSDDKTLVSAAQPINPIPNKQARTATKMYHGLYVELTGCFKLGL